MKIPGFETWFYQQSYQYPILEDVGNFPLKNFPFARSQIPFFNPREMTLDKGKLWFNLWSLEWESKIELWKDILHKLSFFLETDFVILGHKFVPKIRKLFLRGTLQQQYCFLSEVFLQFIPRNFWSVAFC